MAQVLHLCVTNLETKGIYLIDHQHRRLFHFLREGVSFLSNLSGYHNLFSFFLVSRNFFAEPCIALVFQILGVFQLSQEKLKTMGRGGGGVGKKGHYGRCANGELCEKIYG